MSKVLKGAVSFAVLACDMARAGSFRCVSLVSVPGSGLCRGCLSRASRKRPVAVGRGCQHVPILHWVCGGMRDGGSAGAGYGLVHASLGVFEPSGAVPAAYFTRGMASVHCVVAGHR